MAVAANGRTWAAGERNKPDEELLVFGYSCKLFRDNEKAMLIDRGKHLIPWMGDDSLMIDRYDARGYLNNVEEHEPKPGAVAAYMASLSEEERALEDLCEEERFLALFRDLHEESILHEEELKRLNVALNSDGTYKETPFSYDSENSAQELQDSQDDAETPFKAPKGLHIPPSVPTPPTMKLHAIIEKTAVFVSQHGAQMEILVKTKQSSNPQFAFLAFDHPLNVYYRFLVEQIKCGTYIPVQQSSGNEDSDDDDDHYLHPSLFATSSPSLPTAVSKVFLMKEGEDNAYLQLVKNLKPQVDSPIGGASPSQPLDRQQAAALGYADYAGYEGYGAVEDYSQPPPPPGLEPILLPSQACPTGYAIPPPPDVQPIIDKMAMYVAKNGDDFETIVKSKGDKRFDFLLPDHEYHTYYVYKKQDYLSERMETSAETGTKAAAAAPTPVQGETEPTKESSASQQPASPVDTSVAAMAAKLKKAHNGLSTMDDSRGSGSDSPFPSLDSNDGVPQLGPTERAYAKGPVSFSLRLKDSEGKEKKRVTLGTDESDSEERDGGSRRSPSAPVRETPPARSAEGGERSRHVDSSGAKDRLSPSRQLQLERKKRLAKFLSMIKESPASTGVAPPAVPPEAARVSSTTTSGEGRSSSRLSDVQRSPTDSLPGSPTAPAPSSHRGRSRHSARDSGGNSSDGSPPPPSSKAASRKSSSSHSRHRSGSPGSRHRHSRHHRKAATSRSRSRERRHRKHHRSHPQGTKRSGTTSPSPTRKVRSRKSRSKSPSKRK
ncbi:splicing factor, suppressor of white-apricot homolog [Ixodes scapularis]|uniref:splicing factor, suppressor of white-apricot homolog n=1 Tax=Ixodes scapularis TaxID=6945 RepID=UPI001C38E3B8|nr:splicing factor, suppressor of white-apricot homolog [Ixodes scapularis]